MESGQRNVTAALVLAFAIMVAAAILAFVKQDVAALGTICGTAVILVGVFVHVVRLQHRWKHTPGHTYGDMVLPRAPQSRQTHIPM